MFLCVVFSYAPPHVATGGLCVKSIGEGLVKVGASWEDKDGVVVGMMVELYPQSWIGMINNI